MARRKTKRKEYGELDLENTYGNVNWPFVKALMSHLGFGECMSRLICTLGEGFIYHANLNVKQGCPFLLSHIQ